MEKTMVAAFLRKALALAILAVVARGQAQAPPAGGAFTVTNLADSGPGTLREAMISLTSFPGTNTILLSVTGTISLASSLPDVTSSVAFVGPGPSLLTMDGSGHYRFFRIFAPAVTVSFSGLTLSNGLDNIRGGAVLLQAGDEATTLSFTNCVLSDNIAIRGGAVSAFGADTTAGVLNFVDCTVRNNRALSNGGGI